MQSLDAWWQASLPVVEALAPDAENQEARPRNVYVMRSGLLASIEQALDEQQLLTPFQRNMQSLGIRCQFRDHCLISDYVI